MILQVQYVLVLATMLCLGHASEHLHTQDGSRCSDDGKDWIEPSFMPWLVCTLSHFAFCLDCFCFFQSFAMDHGNICRKQMLAIVTCWCHSGHNACCRHHCRKHIQTHQECAQWCHSGHSACCRHHCRKHIQTHQECAQ